MRQYIGVLIGAVLGVVGAILFGQSLTPKPGSETERAEKAEKALRVAEQEVRALRSAGLRAGRRPSLLGARNIIDDVRSGRGASLDDVFAITKPWLKDLSPVINLIRVKEEREQFDRLAGEYGRKYDLSDRQQEQLRRWLDQRARENAAMFMAVLENDSTNFMDLMMVGREAERNTDGIDEFMERQLSGQALADFKADRLMERIESVEGEANGRLNRLDHLVGLEAAQQDELFYLMARSSDDYIPSMEIEGMTGSRTPLDREGRNQVLQSVLRPEQLERLEIHRQNRREETEREMLEVGLRLPENWEQFDEDEW